MADRDGRVTQSGPFSAMLEIAKTLLKKLVFDSTWDFLKAGVLALLFFVGGNFLGLLVPDKRPLELHLNLIGNYFEGYTFLSPAFDRFRSDVGNSYTLVFDPPTLEHLRVCKELIMDEPPTGRLLIDRLAAEFPSCLSVNVTSDGRPAIVAITPQRASTAIVSVERNGELNWFCGCEEKVINAFVSDERNP